MSVELSWAERSAFDARFPSVGPAGDEPSGVGADFGSTEPFPILLYLLPVASPLRDNIFIYVMSERSEHSPAGDLNHSARTGRNPGELDKEGVHSQETISLIPHFRSNLDVEVLLPRAGLSKPSDLARPSTFPGVQLNSLIRAEKTDQEREGTHI